MAIKHLQQSMDWLVGMMASRMALLNDHAVCCQMLRLTGRSR